MRLFGQNLVLKQGLYVTGN